MKAKIFGIFLAICSVFVLAGCGPSITNLTSEQVPQNPSGIYTLSMSVANDSGSVLSKSYKPAVVIDGEVRPMRRSALSKNVFEYDYQMPQGRNEARFYYVLDYETDHTGKLKSYQTQSDRLYTLRLANRYVLTMESLRGPVGAPISIVGRGFQPSDRIVIGGYQAETQVNNSNSITFRVPPLPANRHYPVLLANPQGANLSVGSFYVDASQLHVSPQRLELVSGERSILTVRLSTPAPQGGLLITAQTDIPSSIVMPEVTVPAGQQTVTIPLQGGNSGKGILYLNAAGYSRVEIPTTVRGGSATATEQLTIPTPQQTATEATVVDVDISEGKRVNQINEVEATAILEPAPAGTAAPAASLQPGTVSEEVTVDKDGNVIHQQFDLIPVTN